ncbi:MAG: DUF2281 domain-containing protein [Candidatus Sericytochromatia bacterium]
MLQDQQILAKIMALPPDKKAEVIDFIEFLDQKLKASESQANPSGQSRNGFGSLKGTFVVSPDFDAPLEDFADNM